MLIRKSNSILLVHNSNKARPSIHGGRNNQDHHGDHDGDDDQHAGSCGTEAEQEEVVDIRYQNTLDRNHTADPGGGGGGDAVAVVVVESLPDNPAEGSLRDVDEAVVLVVVGMEIQTLVEDNYSLDLILRKNFSSTSVELK